MSKENVAAFQELVNQNEQLKAQLKETNSANSFVEKAVQMGQQNGFQFSSQELKEYLNEANREEMSDQELESVAGGGAQGFTICLVWSDCWCGSSC